MPSPRLVLCATLLCSATVSGLARGADGEQGSISGVVHSSDGQTPAAKADVHLLRRPDGAYILPVKTKMVRTNEKGEFRFNDVPVGSYKIWAETPKLTTLKKKLGGFQFKVETGKTT